MDISGVYVIKNITDGKMYIGETKNIGERWAGHFGALFHGIHQNNHLQRAWDKHGCTNFEFDIVELCEEWELRIKENHWVLTMNTNLREFGYNIRNTENSVKRGMDQETRDKVSKTSKGRKLSASARKKVRDFNLEPVIVLDENNNIVEELPSVESLREKYNIPVTTASRLLKEERKHKGKFFVKKINYNPCKVYSYEKKIMTGKTSPKIVKLVMYDVLTNTELEIMGYSETARMLNVYPSAVRKAQKDGHLIKKRYKIVKT